MHVYPIVGVVVAATGHGGRIGRGNNNVKLGLDIESRVSLSVDSAQLDIALTISILLSSFLVRSFVRSLVSL